jgi:hypothetical protein
MRIKDNIRRILKEETSVQTKLKNKIDSVGIRNVIKLMGLNTIVKVLNLDLNDVDTQLMLVKNFIYHTKLRDIEVSFLEVKNSASGGKIIKVYFTTESNAGNIESFYARVLCEESEELFPFRVVPSWEPVFASRNVKIFINTEKIKDDEEETSLQESIKRVLKKENTPTETEYLGWSVPKNLYDDLETVGVKISDKESDKVYIAEIQFDTKYVVFEVIDSSEDSSFDLVKISNLPKSVLPIIARRLNSEWVDYLMGNEEESELNEKWSEKYKKSINCNNPKGFSQKAHCAGRKKRTK